jgi:membrane-bound lytic murein transglycosylase B
VSVRAASRTILIVVAVVAALGLVATAVLVFLAPRVPGMPEAGPVVEEPAPAWAPPAEPPVAAAEPGVGIAGLVDAEWLASTAAATDIPERSLAAYAGAALAKSATMPECGLSWNTIAGIGATESDHGRHGGSAVGADGTVTPPIYGVPLAGGEGVEHIPDSDGGALDGDAEFDRAVGPFQLIPQTWRNWHTDGNGDGVEDPHNIDDAAMATANYLCRVSIHIDTEAGWVAAVSGFNSPESYRDSVARYAVRYAEEL